MGLHFIIWIGFFMLAALVGVFADRTSICTVKAVQEVLTTRHAYMLMSFAKTVLWVLGVTFLMVSLFGAPRPAPLAFAIHWSGLFGGFLFGIGAVLNGGCAISTLTRLGNGNLGMVMTLSGLLLGMAIYEAIGLSTTALGYSSASPAILGSGFELALGLLLSIWMVWEIVRLWRTAPSAKWWTLWRLPRFRLSTAALVIGVSNGILYMFLGTWAFTHAFRRSVVQFVGTPAVDTAPLSNIVLWGLFFALLLGVFASTAASRRFALSWRPERAWLRYFWGGNLMGVGAAIVPGGNDVLLLNAIPGLSPHALPAYLAMLTGIFVALMVMKLVGGNLSAISCSADQCQEIDAGGAPGTA